MVKKKSGRRINFNSCSFPGFLGSQGRRLAARFTNPPRTFWVILSIALLFAAVGISTGVILGFSHSSAQVRIPPGAEIFLLPTAHSLPAVGLAAPAACRALRAAS